MSYYSPFECTTDKAVANSKLAEYRVSPTLMFHVTVSPYIVFPSNLPRYSRACWRIFSNANPPSGHLDVPYCIALSFITLHNSICERNLFSKNTTAIAVAQTTSESPDTRAGGIDWPRSYSEMPSMEG